MRDRDCLALVGCLDGCAEEEEPDACVEQCRTEHAAVVEAYDAIDQCTICQECAQNCAASEEPVCQE